MNKKILALAALVMVAGTGLFAQSNEDKRFALVIGNQSYKESPLSNPVADAKLIAERLGESGFDVTCATELTQSGMAEVIGSYAAKVNEAGTNTISFFYYSGHGVQINGKNYMVPIDDEKITNESLAMAKCFAIDQVIEFVNSKTQVIVLDACRNNPFKQTKQVFTKGLTQIATPKKVTNFLTLFSTQAGQTADDGSGRNSLFTECLAQRMTEMNTQILTVFNEVADDVKTKTNGRQTPLVSGTSVKFELMNAKIAEMRTKALKAQLKALESSSASKSSTAYTTEKNILDTNLKIMQERKTASEKDAKEKAEKAKKEAELMAKNKKEMERLQKEADEQKKAFQQQKAKQKSSGSLISEIEDNKQRIQKIRVDAAEKIYAAYKTIDKDTESKIDAVNNTPLKSTEKDSKGKITSAAKKAREAQIKLIKAEGDAEKQKIFERYYDAIKVEEKQRLDSLNKDLDTLKKASYTASSIVIGKTREVDWKISNYDGEHNKWKVNLSSNLFEKPWLFNTDLDLTYESFCKNVLEQKYISPDKMTPAQLDDYDEKVTIYQTTFQGNKDSLLCEVDYKIVPVSRKNSTYKISTSTARVKLMKDTEPVLATKSYSQSNEIVWDTVTVLKSVDQIIAEYEREDIAAAQEAEKIRKQQEKEAAEAAKKAAKEAERRGKSSSAVPAPAEPSYNHGSSIDFDSMLGDTQIPVSGIEASLNFCDGLGFETSYAFPVLNNFFVGPYLSIRQSKESIYTTPNHKENKSVTFVGLGGLAGACWTFDVGPGILDPYAAVSLGFTGGKKDYNGDSKVFTDFGMHFGAAYIIDNAWGIHADLGFNTPGVKKFNINIGGILTADFVKELWN